MTEGGILNGSKFLKRIETDIIELLHMGANESGESFQGRRMWTHVCGGGGAG